MATLREHLRRHLHPLGSGRPGPDRPPPIYLTTPPVETSLTRVPTGSAEDRYGDLIDPQTPPPAPLSTAEAEQLRGYLDDSQAANTRDAYRADWAHFTTWCDELHLASLPAQPATVARYLVALVETGRKVATLTRRLSAISQAHQAAGHDSPTASLAVRKVFAGIKRRHGTQQEAKAPVLPADLKLMVAELDDTPAGKRDRALLLLGFAGAFRRSELVALDVADLEVQRAGLIVTIRRSKTDQEGQGERLGVPRGRDKALCPVRAVEAWIAAGDLVEGPLFRPIDRHGNVRSQRLADFTVVRVVKRLAAAVGLDPDLYGGHSLRAGLATAAAAAGVEERVIMKQTRHTSTRTLRKYIRDGELFKNNAADGLL